MQSLAGFLYESDPDVVALGGIDAGDALAIATRFDREWAYRGRQALLWNRRVVAHQVHDLYLPASPLRPFDRRGLLRVDAECDGVATHLFATEFATDRTRVGDLRFARSAIRAMPANVLLFLAFPPAGRVGFSDLGLRAVSPAADVWVAARGYELTVVASDSARTGLGTAALVRARPTA